ncbi:MAG: T9SS type A sorting domain-containing protein [Bacteroidota bacterium]
MYKLKFYTLLLSFFICSMTGFAQNGSNEPCNAPTITVNPMESECALVTSATINSGSGTVFTNSTSASAGVTLPAVDCNFFNSTTNDWWYKITVPASGYFSLGLTENTFGTYFDWTMYTASSTTCAGSVFTEIPFSNQCIPSDGATLDITGVGPLTPGRVVYIRMWVEALEDQDFEDGYEICVNEAGPPPTECSFPIAPANNSTIGGFPTTLTWTSVSGAAGYYIYLRDVTNGGSFQNLGAVAGTSVSLGGGLSYSTTYEWYTVPSNESGVTNNTCLNKFTFKTPAAPPASTCATATQICAPFSFSAGVDQPDDGGGPDADYDCLLSAPNPEYHWVKITSPGNIRWTVTSNPDQDVDYAVWGPFTGLTTTTPSCGINAGSGVGFPCGSGLGIPIECDYTEDNGGPININSAIAGQYYLILVTNYENTPSTINITTRAGNTAGVECPCLVSELNIFPNADCNNNVYSVDYEVSFNNPPSTGTLTITDGAGHTATLNAPFTSPKTGTITGLTADGAFHTFTASFSANSGCKLCANYTAPDAAPANNTCAVGLPLSANKNAGTASGYTNNCTGNGIGEASYCGSAACRSVFYKIHTVDVAIEKFLSIDINGGNIGYVDDFCPNGVRISVLTDCNTPANVTPSSCQTITEPTGNITFDGLALNTDYYVVVDQIDCTDETCNWNMLFRGIGVLPVTIGSFEVLRTNNTNVLKWTTLNEQNTAQFELLHSTDGITYSSLGMLSAANTRNGQSYTFNDNSPANGLNFYKIKMINKDGTYEYSEVRKVSNNAAAFSFVIAPNPAKDDITVSINNSEKGAGKFIIVDGIGRKLAITDVKLNVGNNKFNFNVSKYNAGILYIRFVDQNGVTVTQRINKIK